jgi:hypothetical protein
MSAALVLPVHSATLSPGVAGFATGPEDLTNLRFRRDYAFRILTASVYAEHPRFTYGILLARAPRFSVTPPHYSQLAPGLAPRSVDLAMYQCGALSWEAFALRYWHELTALPHLLRDARRQVTRLLERYDTLTFLGMTPCLPKEESSVRCVRRLVRAWLLGEQPREIAGTRPRVAIGC